MDLNRKLEIVKTAIKSISEHTDIDSTVRIAALEKVGSMLEGEKHAVRKEVDEQIRDLNKKA